MSTSFDIHLLPIARYAGQEYPDLIGVLAAEPPKRAARSRMSDRLVLYLALAGNLQLSSARQNEILAELSRVFYASQGSVTSAMRAAAEELNKILIDENRKGAATERQGAGLLGQLVLRADQVYLAQSGPLHSILVTENGAELLVDQVSSIQGLGLARTVEIFFAQLNYQANGTILLAGLADPTWNPQSLSVLHAQGPESIRRRLTNQSTSDINLLGIQMRPGKGKIHLLQNRQAAHLTDSPGVAVQPAPGVQPGTVSQPLPVPKPVQPSQSLPAPIPLVKEPETQVVESIASLQEAAPVEKGFAPEAGLKPARVSSGAAKARRSLMAGVRRGVGLLGSFLGRIFPQDVFRAVPSTIMASIAVIVPVVVVTIASVAYFRLGNTVQFDLFYSQAQETAVRAVQSERALEQRTQWVSVLALLDRAERFQVTHETKALRAQANASLDGIDQIKRLNYQPAIVGGLRADVKITRMVVSLDDLYLLDGNSGKVYRAQPTTEGYKIDASFQCGPVSAGASSVGKFIDIIPWSPGYEPKGTVLGVDQAGNLAFCQPGQPVFVLQLALPASAADGLKAVSLKQADLYVMEENPSTIWIYRLGTFDKAPREYFASESEKPADFNNAVALIADREDLYLLHEDGNFTFCFTQDVPSVPVRCKDAVFMDMRPGRENLPMVFDHPFKQVLLSPPPDPSLYFLEPNSHAVYHFSLRSLAFQRYYLPLETLSQRVATAFAIYPARRSLFLAIGNEVYYAAYP